jgi:pyridinium-3,5-bisthiocarboxylic acid mononucleotide nickel chelatase
MDDCTAERASYLSNLLFEYGALDVWTQSINMKKSRLGFKLSVICHIRHRILLMETIFRESTSIGIRHKIVSRVVLPRHMTTVNTMYGEIRVKISIQNDEVLCAKPEFDDCAKLAKEYNVSLQTVIQAAERVSLELNEIKYEAW